MLSVQNKTGQNKGFTLIEVMAVVAILAIATAVTLGSFGNYVKRQQFNTEVNEVERLANEQKTKSITSLFNSEHGFVVASTSVTTFVGQSLDLADSETKLHELLYSLATSSLSYAGVPTTTVYFNKRTGEASATGTIYIYTSVAGVGTSTITIYESGLIEKS